MFLARQLARNDTSSNGLMNDYSAFLNRKQHTASKGGFTPTYLPSFLYDFQGALVQWAIETGRAAIFADCGLGKTPMQLVWAENVVRHTNSRVLILTPLAVGAQTQQQAERFGLEVARSREGRLPSSRIIVANYEQLHRFDPADFAGVVCDESSILKHFTGATQKAVTRFLLKMPYRLLCTATAAPNDWSELGTSSEALGCLGYSDMLHRFFVQVDGAKPARIEDVKRGNHFARLAFRVSQQIGQWRLKGHAEEPFWRWVSSWAKACRKPSDLGFSDGAFVLPPLNERTHVVKATTLPDGYLFAPVAIGFHAEREERRRTMTERCESVAQLVSHADPALVFCQLNTEGDRLTRLIPNAVQISGADSEEAKEEKLLAFCRQDAGARVLVTKSKIAGFGLNLQHCAHVATFVSHSYEAYYQSVRRCWRFGQTKPVTVDVVATEGEQRVSENLARKAQQADQMFTRLLQHMQQAETIQPSVHAGVHVEIPTWLTQKAS